MEYLLKAGAKPAKSNSELVAYIADRFMKKQNVFVQRKNRLDALKENMRFLLSVYNPGDGVPLGTKQKELYYKSMMAHQVNNVLMGSKLNPDFIDYAPLGIEHDKKLIYMTDALTRAHKGLRYQGLYDLAVSLSKKDFIWGNSFIELVLKFDGDDPVPTGAQYQYAPFEEMRNNYGEPDKIRVINYSPEAYAEEYSEDELEDVAEGGIVSTQEDSENLDKSYKTPEGQIQVVRYYNPSRRIFAEIHGGNGKIYQHLEGADYPLLGAENKCFDPFLESRFYEDPTSDFFGYGPMDFIIDLANLDTTMGNAVISDAVWSASAPTIVETNDPDKMRASLRKFESQRAQGRNRVMVEKDSGLGMKGKVTDLSRTVRTDLLASTDEFVTNKATRASNIVLDSLSDFAPTAEQQKIQKIEAGQLNIRVLMLNEQREIAFAKNEMYFLKNTKTKFHDYEIEVEDEFSDKYQGANGHRPMAKKKIGDILEGVNELQLKIQPRLEGALDDMTFQEIQEMSEDIGLMPEGSQAQIIALEKYISKKNPNWGLKRQDFITPAQAGGIDVPETPASAAALPTAPVGQ